MRNRAIHLDSISTSEAEYTQIRRIIPETWKKGECKNAKKNGLQMPAGPVEVLAFA
jgi:hypothetical protein